MPDLDAVEAGITFLAGSQRPNGSFPWQGTNDPTSFPQEELHECTFVTALVMTMLETYRTYPQVRQILEQGRSYLAGEVSPQGTFGYWKRRSPIASREPYPDDLDDTSLALAALTSVPDGTLPGKLIAQYVQALSICEVAPGGPYRTWITAPPTVANRDFPDIIVNSNIAFTFRRQGVTLPELDNFFREAIDRGDVRSPFYRSPLAGAYFLARACPSDRSAALAALIDNLSKEQPLDPLHAALGLSASVRLGVAIDGTNRRRTLLSSQNSDGGWPAVPFVNELIRLPAARYGGSRVLTTAACLEALNVSSGRERSRVPLPERTSQNHRRTSSYTRFAQKVEAEIAATAASLPTYLRYTVRQAFQTLLTPVEREMIASLPLRFSGTLTPTEPIPFPFLAALGRATLYGWYAYRIYDDLYDGEGSPLALTAAHHFHRELDGIFRSVLPGQPAFTRYYTDTMSRVDAANAWELQHCRLPVESDGKVASIPLTQIRLPHWNPLRVLAERSIAYAIGPMAILWALGHRTDSTAGTSVTRFFIHYLIARQLHDDAHDWLTDLENGRLTYPNTLLIRRFQHNPPATPIETAASPPTRKLCTEAYWKHIAPIVARKILIHVQSAQEALVGSTVITNPEPLTELLVPIREAAQLVITQRRQVIDFLGNYNTPKR